MKRRSAIVGASVTMAAAGLGNAFIGRDAMAWFKELRTPRWQLPMAGFLTVGAVYYLIVGYVLARAVDRGDERSVGWAVAVLSANEGWNGLLFGRRSTGAAFLGLLAIYTTYVIAYDLPWSYRLWRLNPPDTAR